MHMRIIFLVSLSILLFFSSQLIAQVKLVFHERENNWLRNWLSEFYNRDYFDFSGKNINWSNPPFMWSVVNVFPMSKQSAIFVRHVSTYYCGNSNCDFDIWIFDGKKYVDISGNMAKKFDEEVEISDEFRNEMPVIFIGPRAYMFNGSEYREI